MHHKVHLVLLSEQLNRGFLLYRRSTALGKYCLKRLPCTCTVVIIEQGEIIFDKKGKLENGMASKWFCTYLNTKCLENG